MKILVSILAFFSMTFAFAGKVETPATLKGAKVATAAEVNAAMKAGAVVIDTRKKLEYVEKHIKGAISIPYKGKE